MLTKPVSGAVVSDIHLGHRRTPTEHILSNLSQAFPDNETTGQLDVIFLAGDVFDQALHYFDPQVVEIDLWIGQFLRMCAKRNIKVRVLEGTPVHDRRQSRHFLKVNEHNQLGVDLKWIDTVCVERIQDLGLDVLYVPDEWRPDPADTLADVKTAMADAGLKQVDLAIMHGAFPYQLPPQAHHGCHDQQAYEALVRHYIFIGHIHLPSQNGKVLAQGSFDRLSHGEEGDKGHWQFQIDPQADNRLTFKVNTGALPYNTVQVQDLEPDQVRAKVLQAAAAQGHGHLRIKSNDPTTVNALIPSLKVDFPQMQFTHDGERAEVLKRQQELLTNRPIMNQIQISTENLFVLLEARLQEMKLDPELVNRARAQLKEAMS